MSLGLYYTAWLRYFMAGRLVDLLSAPLLGLPLPLAVLPVIFLRLSAYLLSSIPMLAAEIVFGAAHIWVTALSF